MLVWAWPVVPGFLISHAPYKCSMCSSSSQHAPRPYSDPDMLPFCKHKHIPCPSLSYFYLSLKICHSSNVSSAIQLCYSSLCISQRSKTVHKYMLVFFRSGVKRLVSICLKTDCYFFRGRSQWERAALLCCQHHWGCHRLLMRVFLKAQVYEFKMLRQVTVLHIFMLPNCPCIPFFYSDVHNCI